MTVSVGSVAPASVSVSGTNLSLVVAHAAHTTSARAKEQTIARSSLLIDGRRET
ncbi:hypothetical protein AKJ09_05721 [Labilithrix luteola]|uniref:Uncharacterized protein n=1 Tax=Labilithrix luteola TaxID=1391654 RepID=A0A0K1PZY5_9BACT|nr:hypothetical protein AKJ09_05721 [Labilithrix luteola]